MSESTETTTTETAPTGETPPAAESPSGPTPPWGDASEFNPEKAWNLIQNLRSDLSSAKASVETARTEAKAQADALTLKAQEAEESAAEVAISLHRERAARKWRLSDDQSEFLAELTDPEAIDARAEKLAALTAEANRPVDPTQGSTAAGTTKTSTADQFATTVRELL
jgi:hypothetical protein